MVQAGLSQPSGRPASSRPWTLTEELWSYIYPSFINQPVWRAGNMWRLLNSPHFHMLPRALLAQDTITNVNKTLVRSVAITLVNVWLAPAVMDGADLPDEVAPSRSVRNAEPRLDTQLTTEIRNSSRSRQGGEEETAMMLRGESEHRVTQVFRDSSFSIPKQYYNSSDFSWNWVFVSYGFVLIQEVCTVIDNKTSLPLLFLFNNMTQVGELLQLNKPKTAAAAAINVGSVCKRRVLSTWQRCTQDKKNQI